MSRENLMWVTQNWSAFMHLNIVTWWHDDSYSKCVGHLEGDNDAQTQTSLMTPNIVY